MRPIHLHTWLGNKKLSWELSGIKPESHDGVRWSRGAAAFSLHVRPLIAGFFLRRTCGLRIIRY